MFILQNQYHGSRWPSDARSQGIYYDDVYLGTDSISHKTFHRKISKSLECARLDAKMLVSLWNLAGASAAVLLARTCKIPEQLKNSKSDLMPSRLARSYDKLSFEMSSPFSHEITIPVTVHFLQSQILILRVSILQVSNIGFITVHGLNEGHIAPHTNVNITSNHYTWMLRDNSYGINIVYVGGLMFSTKAFWHKF